MTADFEIEPRGPFTLASAARFITGWAPTARSHDQGDGQADGDGVVRLGFLVDDWSGHAGVALRQREDGTVAGTITHSTAANPERVRNQAARILSLDHDGCGYPAVGQKEPAIGRLQRASGWLRPVLFHSPYEAACWGVISTRMRQTQATPIRDRLSATHGARLQVAGQELLGFPTPEALLAVTEADGIPEQKLRQLHAIAQAALEDRLDRERLVTLDPNEALEQLQTLPGIGPFWSQAILLRAVGPTDAVTTAEARLGTAAAQVFDNPALAEDHDAFHALAEHWRPYRTWVSVLIRTSVGWGLA